MVKQGVFIPELKKFKSYDSCIIYQIYDNEDELLGQYIGVSPSNILRVSEINNVKKIINKKCNIEENEKLRNLFIHGKDLKIEKLEYFNEGNILKLQDRLFYWFDKILPLNIVSNWYKEYYKNKE